MKKILLATMLALSSVCYSSNKNNAKIETYISEHRQEVVEVVGQLTKQLEEGSIQKEDILALMKEDADFGLITIAATLVIGALVVGGGYVVYDALCW